MEIKMDNKETAMVVGGFVIVSLGFLAFVYFSRKNMAPPAAQIIYTPVPPSAASPAAPAPASNVEIFVPLGAYG